MPPKQEPSSKRNVAADKPKAGPGGGKPMGAGKQMGAPGGGKPMEKPTGGKPITRAVLPTSKFLARFGEEKATYLTPFLAEFIEHRSSLQQGAMTGKKMVSTDDRQRHRLCEELARAFAVGPSRDPVAHRAVGLLTANEFPWALRGLERPLLVDMLEHLDNDNQLLGVHKAAFEHIQTLLAARHQDDEDDNERRKKLDAMASMVSDQKNNRDVMAMLETVKREGRPLSDRELNQVLKCLASSVTLLERRARRYVEELLAKGTIAHSDAVAIQRQVDGLPREKEGRLPLTKVHDIIQAHMHEKGVMRLR